MEGQKHVWEGAIPLQIRLHESEVTTLLPPPPVLLLAPRVGYLPLLLPLIRPHFAASLPPGTDTPWFDYNGLPLKWYIPTGVLFDLLCAEPERPWNLTVHFRGYPSSVLIPCDGEDSVKWSFINSLKEADYIINGNCKNVMHMSQADQVELWQSVLNANLEAYLRASSKLKVRTVEDRYSSLQNFPSLKSQKSCLDGDLTGQLNSEKVPVRLYIRYVTEDFEELEDMPQIDSWDQISYINRPLHFCSEEGKCFTLDDALRTLLPELYPEKPFAAGPCADEHKVGPEEETNENRNTSQPVDSSHSSTEAEIKLLRIQGIEPKLDIPISWMASNLKNPEHFLHLCLFVRSSNLV